MRTQKEQACVTHFGCGLLYDTHTHTHTHTQTDIPKSELADEPRQDVDEGHTCQMCQMKSH